MRIELSRAVQRQTIWGIGWDECTNPFLLTQVDYYGYFNLLKWN